MANKATSLPCRGPICLSRCAMQNCKDCGGYYLGPVDIPFNEKGGKKLSGQMLSPIIDIMDPEKCRARSQTIQIPDGYGGELTLCRQLEGKALFVKWEDKCTLLATGIFVPPPAARATAKLAALNQKVLDTCGIEFVADAFASAYRDHEIPYAVLFELDVDRQYELAIHTSFNLLAVRFEKLHRCRSESVGQSPHWRSAGNRKLLN